jgi:hypothetical protein
MDPGDRYCQARALDGMATAFETNGQPAEARRYWTEALDIYAELELPDADEVRTRLSTMDCDAVGAVVGERAR